MRVVVDFDLCESNALCMQAAPEVFEVRDDDFLYVLQENPPEELRGRINMLDDINSVIHGAERYLGFPRCTSDKAQLKQVNDLLEKAKPFWRTFSYDTQGKMTSGDVDMTQDWNGDAYRIRKLMPTVKFAFTKEGIEGWMDNVSVLKGAGKSAARAPAAQNAKRRERMTSGGYLA